MILTPKGKEFLIHANKIIDEMHKAKDAMNDTAELKIHYISERLNHSALSNCKKSYSGFGKNIHRLEFRSRSVLQNA